MQPTETANQGVSTSGSQHQSGGRFHGLAQVLLVAVCVSVRLWCLACKPFWFDECFSVELARIDWRNFLHLLWWREANMSLYYLLLRLWLHFGHSPFFIRSLSVVIAGATIPAIYWLGTLLHSPRAGLISAALFAFNAYDVRYAQEARSYALFVLLATISSAFLVALLRQPSRRNQFAYVASSILAVYAHFYALLLIAVHWLALLAKGHSDSGSPPPFRRAWITIGLGVSPLLIFVAKTGAGPIKWIQRPGVRDLPDFLEHLSGSTHWSLLVIFVAACGAAIVPAGKRLWARNQGWDTWRCQLLLLWLFFPVVLTVLLSFARPVFLARYMIFCLPALLVLAAVGLARLRPAWLVGPALIVTLFLSSQGVVFVYGHDFDSERDASGAAVDFILEHCEPGDAIIFHIAGTRIPYEFFRSLRAGQNTASPTSTSALGPEILFPHHGPSLDYRDFTGKPTSAFVGSVAPTRARVWLMLMNNSPAGKPDPTTVMLTSLLPEFFPKVARWEFAKVEVRLYSRAD